jgi:hypothetical protein
MVILWCRLDPPAGVNPLRALGALDLDVTRPAHAWARGLQNFMMMGRWLTVVKEKDTRSTQKTIDYAQPSHNLSGITDTLASELFEKVRTDRLRPSGTRSFFHPKPTSCCLHPCRHMAPTRGVRVATRAVTDPAGLKSMESWLWCPGLSASRIMSTACGLGIESSTFAREEQHRLLRGVDTGKSMVWRFKTERGGGSWRPRRATDLLDIGGDGGDVAEAARHLEANLLLRHPGGVVNTTHGPEFLRQWQHQLQDIHTSIVTRSESSPPGWQERHQKAAAHHAQPPQCSSRSFRIIDTQRGDVSPRPSHPPRAARWPRRPRGTGD